MTEPKLTRDEALLLLNDHIGDGVEVQTVLDAEAGTTFCVMRAKGVLSRLRPVGQPGSLDIAGFYRVGNATFDFTNLTAGFYPLDADDGEGVYGIAVEVAPGALMSVVWGAEEESAL